MKEKENVLLEINKAKQITIEMNEKLENFYQNEKEKEKNNNEFIKNTNITLKEILNKLNVIDLNNQKKCFLQMIISMKYQKKKIK